MVFKTDRPRIFDCQPIKRNRQIGNRQMPTSKFYQNLPLNETVTGVEIRTPELAHITIRRFSPDGNYLIAFNQVRK